LTLKTEIVKGQDGEIIISTFLSLFQGSLYTFYRTDELKNGTVVGTDRNGNTYYENKRYFMGRSRWVIYNDKVYMDYDGSQVAPEWYGWLHYKTDLPPTIVSIATATYP